MTNTIDLIKELLSDKTEMDMNALHEIMNKERIMDSMNPNKSSIIQNEEDSPIKINVQIFSETEAILGVKQDLNGIYDIKDVDQIRYVFSTEKEPTYLGKYDGIKDEFSFTKKGLDIFFPNKTSFIYKIINKCKKDNTSDISKYKDIVDARKRSIMLKKEMPYIEEKEGMRLCACCKMVYPLNEIYYSLVGGVIVDAKKDFNAKKNMDKEEIVIEDNIKNYESCYLNICKKCEMVRVNDEFYKQRLRDRKGKWLKANTLMTTEEILSSNIDDIPDIENKALYERRVQKGYLSPSFNNNSSNNPNDIENAKVRCVETGKVFANVKVAGKYLAKEHGPARIKRVLNNPNRIAYGCHWVSIIDD